MPLTRNIIKSFRFEVAKAIRTCDASSKHKIQAGEKHFAYEEVPGHRTNICMACAAPIIERAQSHLNKMADELP